MTKGGVELQINGMIDGWDELSKRVAVRAIRVIERPEFEGC